jgi:flagellar biosynthetic protein FliQ
MNPDQLVDLVRQTILVAIQISAPILVTTLIIGLMMSIFQSVTQITETTLLFIPKLVSFILIFSLTLPWILKIMMRFSYDIFIDQWNYILNASF